jgi:protein-tyrosine phosphatase
VPTVHLRPVLARDGVFNVRDLGGLVTSDGLTVRPRLLLRADALQRCRDRSAAGLAAYGIRTVLDLRDVGERERAGVFGDKLEGPVHLPGGARVDVPVLHHPVLDPTYEWDHPDLPRSELLPHRYQEILESFHERFCGALVEIAGAGGGVAFHCAIGKDRTGLLAMLLLGLLGVPDEAIIEDYVRSARAVPVQVNWMWSFGLPEGAVDDEDLSVGLWSARAVTMRRTLDWLRAVHGGASGYLREVGLGDDVAAALRGRLLAP